MGIIMLNGNNYTGGVQQVYGEARSLSLNKSAVKEEETEETKEETKEEEQNEDKR